MGSSNQANSWEAQSYAGHLSTNEFVERFFSFQVFLFTDLWKTQDRKASNLLQQEAQQEEIGCHDNCSATYDKLLVDYQQMPLLNNVVCVLR